MTGEMAWRRMIGHDGTLLVSLDLWASDRVTKPRAIQAGYRALWSLSAAEGELIILEGPVLLVGRRSVKPGEVATLLIHPLQPAAWADVDHGVTLRLHGRNQRLPVIGTATVRERRDVPATAPLHLGPVQDSPAARTLARPERLPPLSSF